MFGGRQAPGDRPAADPFHGFSRTGYLILVTLFLADGGTCSHGRLARDLFVHPTTITLVTDQLAKNGLVKRAPDPSDRRATP